MGNLCNDNSKETNAYQQFLACKNVLVITLPSRFLTIVDKYQRKNTEQKYRLYTDVKLLPVAKADAVLVDNTMEGYYEFAKYVKTYAPQAKFFVIVDNRYITDLKVNVKPKFRY